MSRTNKAGFMVKLVAFLVISFFLYCMLVAGEYIITRPGFIDNPPALRIESERLIAEDGPQQKLAILEGFNPIFYPINLDDPYSHFRALAEQYSVAPLAPQPNTAVYFCNEGYGLVKYQTDKFGFRNKESVWNRPADIVLIGDSFTHGACLENDLTIAGALGVSLNVVNLATGANNPIQYAALAKTFLPKIMPKYAAIVFYANDKEVVKELEDYYHYKYYFLENNSYFQKNELLPNPNLERFYKEATTFMQSAINGKEVLPGFFERGGLLQRGSRHLFLLNIRALVGAITVNQNVLDRASKLAIDTLASECQRPACEPLLIYIPNSEFWRPDSRAKSYENALAKQASDLSISFWSARQEFSKVPNDEAYAIKGPHLSPLGNALVAKGIKRLVNLD